ncbi:MFS transporter [Ferrimonas futtsuensis]|uniref:MFS transporter n=1 Tax=Ferrimonas futtsuensis TaxID=364764 RepID=UPI000407BEA3|nr:MFS transporter [Ferrimonas futtsuensis]
MTVRLLPTLLLALLLLLPQGLSSGIYSAGSGEIAAALGLSADEASWLNVLYMLGQILSLPLSAWLARQWGSRQLLRVAALVGGVATLATLLAPTQWQWPAWFAHGASASALLLLAHRVVLGNLSFSAISVVQAVMSLVVVLIPLGLYPMLMGQLAEAGLWHWAFALQLIPYLALLYWVRFGSWPWPELRETHRFNWVQGGLLAGALTVVTLLLLKGERYNWFDDPRITALATVTLPVAGLAALAIRRGWGRGTLLESQVLALPSARVGMVNAAVAGFAVMGATMLTSGFVTGTLGYSHAQLGQLELVSFGGMLLGALVAVRVTYFPGGQPDKVVPLGVLMMVIACVLLTSSSAASGLSDLWPAMLLKGLAVGILNVTVVIHILRSLPKAHLLQGVAWFYLFRTLGSMLSIAEFSRLKTLEAANATSVLGSYFNPASDTFQHYSHSLSQGLGASGQITSALLSGALKGQVASVASVNSFQWLIASIACCAVVMVSSKVWAAKQAPKSQS